MTSTKITMTKNSAGKYQYEFTAAAGRLCVAANMKSLGRIEAYLIDANLPKPVSLGFDQGYTPSLWLNVLQGMKLRIVSESLPEAITLITD